MVCPKEKGPDFDFGASVIQSVDKDGNKFLLAGQKSGKLPVPVVIIPQGLSNDVIDDLASRSD